MEYNDGKYLNKYALFYITSWDNSINKSINLTTCEKHTKKPTDIIFFRNGFSYCATYI